MIQEGEERRVKKILKKLRYTVCIILSVIMIINAVPSDIFEYVMEVYAEEVVETEEAAPTSGTCGENLTWELSEDGTLTISGVGEMEKWDYTDFNASPWRCNSTNIKRVVITDGVTMIGEYAFYHCDSLIEIVIPNSVTIIGDNAFSGCSSLIEITIPDSVTTIGERAFIECSGLIEIDMSDSVTMIEKWAFSGCSSLTEITIPDSVTTIGESAFSGCSGLIKITIPRGLTAIEEGVFGDCTSLSEITVPDSVMTIGEDAFSGCSSLTEIAIPDSVITIGDRAFSSCSSLTVIKIPDNVTTIGDEAFRKCSSLVEIIIPKNVTTIGKETFYECRKLKKITISDSVTTIGEYAFYYCTSLEKIKIPDNVKIINSSTFFGCDELTEVVISDSVITIGRDAFFSCDSITEITIPDSVTTIGDYAFCGCSNLTNITISRNMRSIRYKAFAGCNSLINVYYNGTEEEWNNISIEGYNEPLENATIHYNSTGPEEDSDKDVFNMNVYRADHLLDTSHPTHSNLEEYMNMDTPSNIFVTELQKNGFEAWENAWTSLTTTFDTLDAPSSLPEFVVEQKDVYSAIILEVLEASTKYGMVDAFEDALSDCPSYVAEIVDILKLKYDIDIAESYDFKNMSSKQQDIVKGVCEDYFNNYLEKDVVQVDSVFSKIGTALDVADCIETYVEYISSAIALTQMSDALKTVLHTMEEKDPASNLFLSLALDDCVEIIDSSTSELLDKFIEKKNFMILGESAKYMVDKLWDVVKDAVNVNWPYLDAILVGYKAGKLISNSLFKTDETIEKYCIMLAVLDVRNLMDQTYRTLELKYQTEKNTANAEAYLSAVDVIFTIIDKDCESAYNFVDVLDKALATRIDELLNGEEDDPWQSNKNNIANIQMSFYGVHEQMLRDWIIYLMEDYPDQPELYDKYQSLREESMNRILNKKYLAACPVDVYVYDLDNNLVAYVKDNKAYSNGEVTVVVENDTKALYFYNDDEYRLEYVGNDSGDMDLTVTEYGDDEEELRNVYFYDVPLTDGQTYETAVDARTLNDTSYSLEENSEKIEPDLDTNHVNVNKRKVKINSGYMIVDEESVFETEAYPDEQVDIYAYVPEGYEFVKWTSDAGKDIFTDSSARITTLRMPNKDITVTAELRKKNNDETTPGDDTADTPENPGATTGDTDSSATESKPPTTGAVENPSQPSGNENNAVLPPAPVQKNEGSVVYPVGTTLTDSQTNGLYMVTEEGASVAYVQNLNKKAVSAAVPATVTFGNITYKVTSIAANAFSGCKKLKTVTIGNNVTTIGNNAFKKCTALKKVIIPARVTTIGKNAFAGCKKLKKVIVKTKALKKIGKNAFKGINKAAKIKVPKRNLTVYKKLFKKAKLEKSVKITK